MVIVTSRPRQRQRQRGGGGIWTALLFFLFLLCWAHRRRRPRDDEQQQLLLGVEAAAAAFSAAAIAAPNGRGGGGNNNNQRSNKPPPPPPAARAAVALSSSSRKKNGGGGGGTDRTAAPRLLPAWARENGVRFHDNVQLRDYGGDCGNSNSNWGVALVNQKNNNSAAPIKPGTTVLLEVPRRLVWNAAAVKAELERELGAEPVMEALAFLRDRGYHANCQAEFLLFLKLIREKTSNSSQWQPWLNCLPRANSLQTAVYWNAREKECLPTWTRAVAEMECRKLQAFTAAARQILDIEHRWKFGSDSRSVDDVEELFRWAFAVVYSRCFTLPPAEDEHDDDDDDDDDDDNADGDDTNKSSSGDDDDDDGGRLLLHRTCLVPLGDMFNHREPANVFVVARQPDDGSIRVIFKGPSALNDSEDNEQQLYLSYGQDSNPHRFLAVFGFVNDAMTECFSEIAFANACERHRALGCDDAARMVFRVADGAASNAVRDSVLFALLATLGRADEQAALCEAAAAAQAQAQQHQQHQQQGNSNSNHDEVRRRRRALLHAKYATQVDAVIARHAHRAVTELDALCARAAEAAVKNATLTEKKSNNNNSNPNPDKNMELILRHNRFLRDAFRRVVRRHHRSVGDDANRY